MHAYFCICFKNKHQYIIYFDQTYIVNSQRIKSIIIVRGTHFLMIIWFSKRKRKCFKYLHSTYFEHIGDFLYPSINLVCTKSSIREISILFCNHSVEIEILFNRINSYLTTSLYKKRQEVYVGKSLLFQCQQSQLKV